MSFQDTIDGFIHAAGGGRVSGRAPLRGPASFLPEEAAKSLREQWKTAGRDNARVMMRFTESDGSNPHYVTAWDGADRFVCYTKTGLNYVSKKRLEQLTIDESWDDSVRLIEIRAPILQENMEKGDVDELLDRVRRTMIKSNKKRRSKRFKAFAKFFEERNPPKQNKQDKADTPYDDSETVNAPQGGLEYRTGAPDEPPHRDRYAKSGKGGKGKSYKPDLKGRNQVEFHKESMGRCAVCGTMRIVVAEDEGCDECGARELVDNRYEKGKWTGSDIKGGNKSDPQLDDRKQVDLRQESEKDDYEPDEGYWGGGIDTPEDGAREKVAVRAEAITAKKKFEAKAPLGAKKPLVMFMLMKKKKGKDDSAVSGPEGDDGDSSGMDESVFEAADRPQYKLLQRPDEETDRQDVDQIADKVESVLAQVRALTEGRAPRATRRSFKLVGEDEEWHKAHAHKFLKNMMRFKNGGGRRKKKKTLKNLKSAPAEGQWGTPPHRKPKFVG